MFRFAHPHALWLLAIIPLMVALFWLAARNRRKRLERFGQLATLRELMPDASPARVRLKFILLCCAIGLLILSIARPQIGSKLREEKAQGIEMMLAVDVSNSMLAEDFEPNRLERTKYAINQLFEGLQQDRVGLIVFAGEAKVQLPITADYRMAKAFAQRIDPSLVSIQGTDIAQALSLATLSFSSDTGNKQSRAIILITDGEGHEGDLEAAAERAAEQGIRVYAIGIGTPEGAPIKMDGEFLKDDQGNMVVSKLDESSLEEVVKATGGAYVRATKQDIGLDEIIREINDMERSELGSTRFEEFNEQFQYLLAIALVLLLLEFLLLDRKDPLLARFNIFHTEKKE
ncbi:MAG: VWA domain-containing protein [Alistipes sp.]